MKILHTSDWHIGQRLYNNYRDEEHQLFFDWLVAKIDELKIDLLIVSGDIFDVAFPSNQALKLYYQTLNKISASYCKNVIITGGNHDSVSTLNAPKEILNFLNIHIIGGVSGVPEDEIIEIKNENGQVEVVVCAVPFLRDSDIRNAVAGESFDDKIMAVKEGISKHYRELSSLTRKYKEKNIPVIATGHLYTNGAVNSDSERDIYIGNLGSLSSENILYEFDYLALGHIHRPQRVAKNDFIRYSGSPIPLSFSEQNDKKSLVLLNISAKAKNIELIEVPLFRKLLSVKGDFSSVKEKLKTYESETKLTDWAEVLIEEQAIDLSIRNEFEKLKITIEQIEVLKYNVSFAEEIKEITNFYHQQKNIADIEVTEVFENMLSEQNIANKKDLTLLFKELMNTIED